MSFWQDFLVQLAGSAITGASVTLNKGGDLKQVGISAGLTALLGAISFVANHPTIQHPSITAAVDPPQAKLPLTSSNVEVTGSGLAQTKSLEVKSTVEVTDPTSQTVSTMPSVYDGFKTLNDLKIIPRNDF